MESEKPGQTPEPTSSPPSPPTAAEKKDSKGPAGGFDSTPVARQPPGYTVRITFHRAARLPVADLTTFSSDPFLTAEVKTALPTRHKEDPLLRFRSRTIWGTTEPEWNEQWIIEHVPASGFKLKIRLYDEDIRDTSDRLGNVHITVPKVDEKWEGFRERDFDIKKRSGSWRAYALRGIAVCTFQHRHMSGEVCVSAEVLGRSPGEDGGRAYTVGKNYWFKHHSPLLGMVAGRKEDNQENGNQKTSNKLDESGGGNNPNGSHPSSQSRQQDGQKKQVQHYSFQANQFQLRGPVPAQLYHRYVEFKGFIKQMFTATGVRGYILSKGLHHQHTNVYNFNRETQYGEFDHPCDDMTLKFLELCHFDRGGRIHTYVITLDGMMRFTETGKEFGIDLLSKHSMHSDCDSYIAYSGEFFIRRTRRGHGRGRSGNQDSSTSTLKVPGGADDDHSSEKSDHSRHSGESPRDASRYELVIDNDSGTYRPNASMLPLLREFLSANFPGLKIVTLDCQKDAELMGKLKDEQREKKKREGQAMVFRQPSRSRIRSGSVSSSDEEQLEELAESPAPTTYKHRIGEAVGPFVRDHSRVRHALGERPVSSERK